MARAVLGRIGETNHASGGRRGESGRKNVARRRVQAADFALRFSRDGRRGLKLLKKAKDATGLAIITGSDERPRRGFGGEICRRDAVGARNMQNFMLLKELGNAGVRCY